MDKEYKKISDTEGEIVTTQSETVTLSSLTERQTELTSSLAAIDERIAIETTNRDSYIASIATEKTPLQQELDKVTADIAGLTDVGLVLPPEDPAPTEDAPTDGAAS